MAYIVSFIDCFLENTFVDKRLKPTFILELPWYFDHPRTVKDPEEFILGAAEIFIKNVCNS